MTQAHLEVQHEEVKEVEAAIVHHLNLLELLSGLLRCARVADLRARGVGRERARAAVSPLCARAQAIPSKERFDVITASLAKRMHTLRSRRSCYSFLCGKRFTRT